MSKPPATTGVGPGSARGSPSPLPPALVPCREPRSGKQSRVGREAAVNRSLLSSQPRNARRVSSLLAFRAAAHTAAPSASVYAATNDSVSVAEADLDAIEELDNGQVIALESQR